MKIKLSDNTLQPLARAELQKLTRREAVALLEVEQQIRAELLLQVKELEDRVVDVGSKHRSIIMRVFGASSEKSPTQSLTNRPRSSDAPKPPKKKTVKLPSERYPGAEIVEKIITPDVPPNCPCCQKTMTASGMFETSEVLTRIPARFVIERQKRTKFRCGGCHGSVITTPFAPRIIPGSTYSNDMIIDVSLSKFLDLIPMERYCQIASRQGFPGLPPNSLIGTTLKLADFLASLYSAIKTVTLAAPVLFADETPHRMLEGDEKKNWYLWLFMSASSAYYEVHNTRSGDVASKILEVASCHSILTDVYAGYRKAVREANEKRREKGLSEIIMAYCNAHARRGFNTHKIDSPREAEHMIESYQKIYRLNSMSKEQPENIVLELREEMRPIFAGMYDFATYQQERFSSKSALGGAFNYFTNNYTGLTVFLTSPDIPIDNNSAERRLRSHVVGRKTWYGTHSQEAAHAAAVHLTIIESCKLNGVNPREFYPFAVDRVHKNLPPITPAEYAKMKRSEGESPPDPPIKNS